MKLNRKTAPLGELETDIMEVVWRLKAASVRAVLETLNQRKPIAYTTVMTVMARLFDKGILKRSLDDSGAYIYRPAAAREKFFANASKKMINNLIHDYGEVAVAQFFDALESSNLKDLKKWQTKLKKIK